MHLFHVITTFILCITIQNYSMEPAVVGKKQHIASFDSQQKVMLHLSDKNDFSIKKWKIFESTALYKDYLRRQKACGGEVKNMSLLYSNANLQEMQLYSGVCDVEPQGFKEHFDALSPAQRTTLFIVTGEHGKNPDEKKLNASNLNAKLWELLLEKNLSKEFVESNIKCRMEQSDWIGCCTNEMAKDNISWLLPDHRFDAEMVYQYTSEGHIQEVPSCLVNGSYDGPVTYIATINNGEEFTTGYIKALKDSFQYRITQSVCANNENKKDNEVLLWLMNSLTNCGKAVPIRHDDRIYRFQFSDKGEYLLTCSDKETHLTQLIRKEDDQLSTNRLTLPVTGRVGKAVFNKQATALGLYCYNSDNKQDTITVWDISSNNCVKKFEQDCGLLLDFLFNDEGNRLCMVSFMNETESMAVTLLDTSNLSAICAIDTFITAEDVIQRIMCSPNGKQWALTCAGGTLIFVDESNSKLVVGKKELLLKDYFNPFHETKRIKMVYSPDNRFVAVLYSTRKTKPTLALYNVLTYEELDSWSRWADGLGFTADSRELIFHDSHDSEGFCGKIDLFPETGHRALDDLQSKTSLLQLALLRRLYRAHANKDTVEFYEEGLAYKSWLLLPKEQRKFIEKCFPVIKVVNNHKDLSETCKDVVEITDAWLENSKKSFLSWWDGVGK